MNNQLLIHACKGLKMPDYGPNPDLLKNRVKTFAMHQLQENICIQIKWRRF